MGGWDDENDVGERPSPEECRGWYWMVFAEVTPRGFPLWADPSWEYYGHPQLPAVTAVLPDGSERVADHGVFDPPLPLAAGFQGSRRSAAW